MMAMWSLGCSANCSCAAVRPCGVVHSIASPSAPAANPHRILVIIRCLRFAAIYCTFPGIGESHPARSAGFTPRTKPLKANVDGWNGPTKPIGPEG
jgi:hypothetical protein